MAAAGGGWVQQTKTFNKVTHCIFDLDGTLLATQHIYDKICTAIFAKYGKEFTLDWRVKIIGLTSEAMWKLIQSELNFPTTWQNLLDEYRVKSYQSIRNCSLQPGVENLVRHFNKLKIPMAIATSSTLQSMETKTEHIEELISMFSHTVCGGSDNEISNSKPDPQIFLLCASRFSSKPKASECLVFEDAPNGVAAAYSAGMQCVAIPEHLMPLEQYQSATLILNSMEEFKPEQFGLPPF